MESDFIGRFLKILFDNWFGKEGSDVRGRWLDILFVFYIVRYDMIRCC